MTIEDLHSEITNTISNRDKKKFVSLNLHGLYLQFKDHRLRSIQKNSIVRVDGMPIVFIAKILGYKSIKGDHRVTWMDWKDDFFKYVNYNGYRIFYLGSKQDLQSGINEFMTKNYPKIEFTTHHGYFKSNCTDEDSLIKEINNFKPNILLVGMGMPKQEYWAEDNLERIDANAIITCGAAMEYITGYVTVPPRWMGRLGFEWLYRLFENPKRFFFRYIVEPWLLLYQIIKYHSRND